MTITVLTAKNFEADVMNQNDRPYVVRFWATWCAPCTRMKPVFQSLAEDLKDQADFGEVDIDKSPELAGRYAINGVPMVLVFKNSQLVKQVIGAAPKSTYLEALRPHLTI